MESRSETSRSWIGEAPITPAVLLLSSSSSSFPVPHLDSLTRRRRLLVVTIHWTFLNFQFENKGWLVGRRAPPSSTAFLLALTEETASGYCACCHRQNLNRPTILLVLLLVLLLFFLSLSSSSLPSSCPAGYEYRFETQMDACWCLCPWMMHEFLSYVAHLFSFRRCCCSSTAPLSSYTPYDDTHNAFLPRLHCLGTYPSSQRKQMQTTWVV